ncbi:MAG: hypothetical protein ACR2K2_13805 [Mycobacteriales bacterium]
MLAGLLGNVLGDLPVPTGDLLGLLDTSLLSLGALDVTTLARSGDTDAADVTGSLAGLDVLGTDVLSSVLGKGSVDLTTLLGNDGAGLGSVTTKVNGLLGTVTDVLGTAGVTLPLPKVEILRVVEETLSQKDGTKTARAGVEALSLTWALDELKIPAVSSLTGGDIIGGLPVALPTAGLPLGANQAQALPTGQLTGLLSGAQLTSLLSEPLSLVLGDLTDTAVFTAAGAVPPTVVGAGDGRADHRRADHRGAGRDAAPAHRSHPGARRARHRPDGRGDPRPPPSGLARGRHRLIPAAARRRAPRHPFWGCRGARRRPGRRPRR